MKLCAAGRTAFFGGRWTKPCPNPAIHVIGAPGGIEISLCDPDFQAVNAAGLVTEPYMDPEEFHRRSGGRKN